MTIRLVRHGIATTLAAALLAVSVRVGAADAPLPPDVSAQVDLMVQASVQGVQRMFAKSAAFCTEQGLPEGVSFNERLAEATAAVSTGSREAFQEIATTHPAYFKSMPVPDSRELTKADRAGDQMLKNAMTSPAKVCEHYASHLQSQVTPERFKAVLLNFATDEAARAHCAAKPRPTDCQP